MNQDEKQTAARLYRRDTTGWRCAAASERTQPSRTLECSDRGDHRSDRDQEQLGHEDQDGDEERADEQPQQDDASDRERRR